MPSFPYDSLIGRVLPPVGEAFSQICGLIGMLVGQVVLLAGVIGEMVDASLIDLKTEEHDK